VHVFLKVLGVLTLMAEINLQAVFSMGVAVHGTNENVIFCASTRGQHWGFAGSTFAPPSLVGFKKYGVAKPGNFCVVSAKTQGKIL
jgi:hypothetical protein